jgi:hypothetical protein
MECSMPDEGRDAAAPSSIDPDRRTGAFGAPMFMGDGEPQSVKFDIGFGTILDHSPAGG